MEFYVIDPKMIGYQEWLQKVEEFLEPYSKVDVQEGAVHSTGTDIAEIWHEESILFVAEGEAGGMIEVRD
ncbi:MAG: hypothetical protein VYD19_05485, partial [Myxococcota bacterium]|nr:hypothetical protein [Myxococcota bacterium]